MSEIRHLDYRQARHRETVRQVERRLRESGIALRIDDRSAAEHGQVGVVDLKVLAVFVIVIAADDPVETVIEALAQNLHFLRHLQRVEVIDRMDDEVRGVVRIRRAVGVDRANGGDRLDLDIFRRVPIECR